MKKHLKINDIEMVLCRFRNIDTGQIKIRSRKREIVKYRQEAHYFAKLYAEVTLSKIGEYFGRHDHSTVLHSCKVIANLCDTNKAYAQEIDRLNDLLQQKNNETTSISVDEIRRAIRDGLNLMIAGKLRELKKLKTKIKELSYD